jgi:hypothetical protein
LFGDQTAADTALVELVVLAFGGLSEVRKCADLDDLPPKYGGQDALRDLARYVVGTAVE